MAATRSIPGTGNVFRAAAEAACQQALTGRNLATLAQLQANFAPMLRRANAALAASAPPASNRPPGRDRPRDEIDWDRPGGFPYYRTHA